MNGAAIIRPDWIAVDWGTSNLRVWAMSADDRVLDEAATDRGMGGLKPEEFEPALIAALGDWQLAPATLVLACGMVGARQGWIEARYRPVPAVAAGGALTGAPASDPRLDVRIAAGLSQAEPPDVMRGEETQIAGFLSARPGWDGVLCLPGTHTKWAQVSAGEIVSFRSFMTGELFALLARQSVLRHTVPTEGWDDDAFRRAVDSAISRPEAIAGRLFGLRAADLLHGRGGAAARAELSGLLIGAELAATRPYWLGQAVVLIGSAATTDAYRAALAQVGVSAEVQPAGQLTLQGLVAIRRGMGKARRAARQIMQAGGRDDP